MEKHNTRLHNDKDTRSEFGEDASRHNLHDVGYFINEIVKVSAIGKQARISRMENYGQSRKLLSWQCLFSDLVIEKTIAPCDFR